MKKIALQGKYGAGKYALVDDEDFDVISQHRWHLTASGYAARGRKVIKMHNHIMRPIRPHIVDHKNRDKLDNRKSNLRLCTQSQNVINALRTSKSGYRGVERHRGPGAGWSARIKVDGRRLNLGTFSTADDAARAYNSAAAQLHGEFAILNEVD